MELELEGRGEKALGVEGLEFGVPGRDMIDSKFSFRGVEEESVLLAE
jgi:hypothetical protein